MNSLTILGKYLDQPMLIAKFSKSIPAVLVTGGSAYAVNHIYKTPKENKRKESIKTAAVLTGTISSALVAPPLVAKIFNHKSSTHEEKHENEHEHEHCHNHEHCKDHEHVSEGHIHEHDEHAHGAPIKLSEVKTKQSNLIDEFLTKKQVKPEVEKILNDAKGKVLKFSQVKTLFSELMSNVDGKNFLNKLIPNPEHIDSKHIFGEIGKFSLLGLILVSGGIAGGIIGDKLTEKDWKERIPNKIKEGSYQYLANIFLCNVGAGVALFALEKANIKSKPARVVGMFAGIIGAGVIAGSAMANFIGKTCIDPLFKNKKATSQTDLYSERKPELLDVGLHVDDVATVAVMSGLKWIEPALPILYSISAFRAGIGYRNGEQKK